MTTRLEHIKWCKERAIKELNYYGDNPEGYKNALLSMASDLRKHEETNRDPLITLCVMQIMFVKSRAEVIKFIEGFN